VGLDPLVSHLVVGDLRIDEPVSGRVLAPAQRPEILLQDLPLESLRTSPLPAPLGVSALFGPPQVVVLLLEIVGCMSGFHRPRRREHRLKFLRLSDRWFVPQEVFEAFEVFEFFNSYRQNADGT